MAYDLERIKAYVDNPSAYTDYTYQVEPETYLAVPVYQQFMASMGREPTQNELAAFAPYTQSMGHSGVKQYIAQYAESQNATKNENERLDKEAGQYSGSINDIYQSLLSRGATSDELQHFGRMMASGEVDAYTINEFLKQSTEYQTTQDEAMRESLSEELAGYDQSLFNKGKEDIISRYASMGRQGSSSLDYALTDMLGEIANQRSEWLANLSASQYGSNKESARADYTTSMNDYLSDKAYSRSQQDALTQRGWDVSDYYRQSNDYQKYLDSQKKDWWQYALPGATQATGQLGAAAIMA